MFSCKFAACFRTPSPKNTYGGVLLSLASNNTSADIHINKEVVSFPRSVKDTAVIKTDSKNLFKDVLMQLFDLHILFSIYLPLYVLPGTLTFFVFGNSDFLVYCAVLYDNICRKTCILRDKTSGI